MVKITTQSHVSSFSNQTFFEITPSTSPKTVKDLDELKKAYVDRNVEAVTRLASQIGTDLLADIQYNLWVQSNKISSVFSQDAASSESIQSILLSPNSDSQWLLCKKAVERTIEEHTPISVPLLPNEMLLKIVSYLPSSCYKELRLVSKNMRELIDSIGNKVAICQPKKYQPISAYLLERYEPSRMVSLQLGSSKVSQEMLHSVLEKTVNLKIFSYFNTEDSDLAIINSLPLDYLDISGSREVTDSGILHLSELSSIKQLKIASLPKITNIALQALASLTNLKELSISNCQEIGDEGLEAITALRQLSDLDISYLSNITDQGITSISRLGQVCSINLRWCDQITHIGIQALSATFRFSLNQRPQGTKIHLNVSYCKKLDQRAFYHIALCSNLRSLDVSGCMIDTTVLMYLRNTFLRELIMQNCVRVEDSGLNQINCNHRIHKLDIKGCRKVTDKGLKYLGEMEDLQWLNISGCEKVTIDGMLSLQRRRLGLHIESNEPYTLN